MMDSWSITGTTWSPRCTASFNNIADTTVDRFIEACSLVLSPTGFISVRIANRVVKCGVSLPKTIYISI